MIFSVEQTSALVYANDPAAYIKYFFVALSSRYRDAFWFSYIHIYIYLSDYILLNNNIIYYVERRESPARSRRSSRLCSCSLLVYCSVNSFAVRSLVEKISNVFVF